MSAQGLPINLLAQFVPRPPPEFQRPPRAHKFVYPGTLSEYVEQFEKEAPPPREPFESPLERRNRKRAEKQLFHSAELELLKQQYKPNENADAQSDPYKTLFVGRLAYETTERTLKRVFEEWGHTKNIRIVCDKDGKSRGYGFVEYEDERDLKSAYKRADGIRIDGRSILVDVERGRTVPDWLPRRLGAGKGPGRTGFDPKQKPQRKSFPAKRPRSPYRDDRRDQRHRGNDWRDDRHRSHRGDGRNY